MSTFRIFRVCTTGPYFDLFRTFVQSLCASSFESAMQACRESGFLYPADFKVSMENAGATVMEVIVDMADLQKKWLVEEGYRPEEHETATTFFKQLAAFKPDIVHFQTFFALPHEVRKQIKSRFPGVKLVTGHRGFPIMNCTGYEDVDAVFLGYPRYHDRWHAVGVKTFHHNHSFDESLLPSIRNGLSIAPKHDFTFIGTTGWGFGPHDGRYYEMVKLLRKTKLEIWGNEPARVHTELRTQMRDWALDYLERAPTIAIKVLYKMGQYGPPIFKRAATAAFRRKAEAATSKVAAKNQDIPTASATTNEYWYLKEKPIRELFPERMHPPVFGLNYLQLLASSRVTWNRHLEMDGAGANMRLFEACGVGTCQLTDERSEVSEAFEPEKEVVTYRTTEECIDKARYLLANESVRVQIASAGQARVLRDHTTAQRAREMHGRLLELLGR